MRVFLSILLLIAFCAWPLPGAAHGDEALDPRAQRLLDAIAERASLPISHKRWFYSAGPWGEYLDILLWAPFTVPGKAESKAGPEKGDCESLIAWLRGDFLMVYPYLAPAHAKPHVHRYFLWTVLYQFPGLQYCRAHAELKLARDQEKRGVLMPFPFDASTVAKPPSLAELRRWLDEPPDSPLETRTENTLCEAFEKLTRFALLYRYPPAVRDLVTYSRSAKLLKLTAEQSYVLTKIAAKLGIDTGKTGYGDAAEDRRIDPETRDRLDRFVNKDSGDPESWDIYQTSWNCLEPGLDPFLKAPLTKPADNRDRAERPHWPWRS